MYLKLSTHITNGLIRLNHSCACCLSAVHCGTAAESDNTLTSVLIIHILAFLDIRNSRIRLNAVINDILNADFFELCKHRIEKMKSHKTLIGYDKNLFNTLILDKFRQS